MKPLKETGYGYYIKKLIIVSQIRSKIRYYKFLVAEIPCAANTTTRSS